MPSSLHPVFPKYMISCVVVFDGRVTRVVYDDTHQGLLESCVKFIQTVVVVRFISKLRNSRRNGKIDILCISVWDGTALYYCHWLLLAPLAKGLWKHYELVSVNLCEFILAPVLRSASLCIRLRNILRKCFVTAVLTLPTGLATS